MNRLGLFALDARVAFDRLVHRFFVVLCHLLLPDKGRLRGLLCVQFFNDFTNHLETH
jgi:hypothetical protein